LQKEAGTNQPMRLRSFAILEPCGLGMFRGVEFVCCPKELEERIEKVVDLESSKKETTGDEDDEDDEDDEEDDEEYSEEEEEDKAKKEAKTADEQQQDPYFKDDVAANEHDRFREAEERLEKKHRKKVTKVITEWSELFERYNKMKEKDPKGAEQYKREM
jgi:amyloid beta A4 protein